MKSKKSIDLIAFNADKNLQYEGECKLKIDRISKIIFVQPKKEERKLIIASFKWNFVLDKNIIFVFAAEENESNDFVLIFNDEIRCKKVYTFICKENTAKNYAANNEQKRRFLNSVCKKIAKKDDDENLKIYKIIKEWIDRHQKNGIKGDYLKILKENNVFDLVYPSNEAQCDDGKNASETSSSNLDQSSCNRKRRFVEISGGGFAQNKGQNISSSDVVTNKGGVQTTTTDKSNKRSKIFSKTNIKQSQFNIVNLKKTDSGTVRRRLLIYTSAEKNECYEYLWSFIRKVYNCIGCKTKGKRLVAISDKEENELECIKLNENEKHVCTPIPYTAEKYTEMKIVKKPGYEFLENCNTFTGKLLLIFNEKNQNQCWEFRSIKGKDIFQCRKCKTYSKLWNLNTENEYVEIRNAGHCCEFVPYELKKYFQFNDYILSPNFEIKTTIKKNGEEKKKLIVFDKSGDKSLCYIYSYFEKTFRCDGCQNGAKVFKNSDGEEYVILSKKKHICKLRSYEEFTKNKDIITLYLPDFKLIEETTNEVKKLIIFDSNVSNLCYTFTQKTNSKCYVCLGCIAIQKYQGCNSEILSRKGGKIASAQLHKNENTDEYFVELNDSPHMCKPQKYESEKFEKKEISKYFEDEYFYFRPKNLPSCIMVAFYHPKNRDLCFPFIYQKSTVNFLCRECKKKKFSHILKIKEDEEGKEYFNHDLGKHICKPAKVSSILRDPQYVILKRNEFNFEKKNKPEIIDEKRIIKAPNFELGPNKNYIPDASLFVFHSQDRSSGFRYQYSNFNKYYVCSNGSLCGVNAKIQVVDKDSGEKVVILSKNEHKCAPIKYEKPIEIEVKTAAEPSKLFELHPNSKGDPDNRLIIFTSVKKEYIYEYTKTSKKSFHCLPCKAKKKNIMVKLMENKNGQKYLEYCGKQEHICEPRKYDLTKYEKPKIISSESFIFHDGKNGEKNKYLVIFISDKKDFVYQYYMDKPNIYTCNGCSSKRKWVGASVITDNNEDGNKTVKLGQQVHICEPRKYDPTKYGYTEPKIISSDHFAFHDGSNGEKDKYLVIFTSEKKDFVYQYYSSRPGYYTCNSCVILKHHTSAIVIEDEDTGAKSLKLHERDHICEPRKYDPTKYIYLEPKIISNEFFIFRPSITPGLEEKDKYLILFTSEKKDFCYLYYMVNPGNYICHECNNKMKHYVPAKIIEDENGLKFLKLSSEKEHICEPKKYAPEKFDRQRIISSDGFVLHSNAKGEKEKHLMLFTSEKRNFVYQYFMAKPGYYMCNGCVCKKRCVSATIIQDKNDGTKSLKLNEKVHICKPRKFDPKKWL